MHKRSLVWPAIAGAAATLAMALGHLGHAWLPEELLDIAAVAEWRRHRLFAMYLTLTGMIAQVLVWWWVRPSARFRPSRWLLVWWSLPLLVATPLFSRDMYAYLDQGWMVGAGFDPYVTAMGSFGPFSSVVDTFWQGTTSVYPPGILLIQAGVVELGNNELFPALWLMRLPAVASVAFLAWAVPVLARRLSPRLTGGWPVWWALLNPITVTHLIGGGHNDAVMLALMVAALLLATTGAGWWWAAGVVGLAALVKQPALLAAVAVPLIGSRHEHWGRRGLAAAASVLVAVSVFVLGSLATLGFGWMHSTGAPSKAYTVAPACLLRIILKTPGWVSEIDLFALISGACLATIAILLPLVWWYRWRSAGLFLGLAFAVVLMLGPSLHPWYLTFALIPLATTKPSRALACAAMTVSLCVHATAGLQDVIALSTLRTFGMLLPLWLATGWWLWSDGLAPVLRSIVDNGRVSAQH